MEDLYQYERDLNSKGIKFIGGVDEVGRGPLLGNVVAACVVLPNDFQLEGLTDSKKLSEKKRDAFYKVIMEQALAVGIGRVSEEDIDKYNMEYSNLELVYNNTFHDRYIIVDKTIIYHLGASINHAGSKTFSINILEDEIVKNALINNIKAVQ